MNLATIMILGLLAVEMSDKVPDQWLESSESVTVEQDIVYGKGGGRDLKLALFRPANTPLSESPAIVFVHGGGWRKGSPRQFSRQAYLLAERGYVSVCIEYRLSSEAIFPAAIEDVKAAIRWMRANAPKYHVNPDKIAVAGGSAGGHLALLAGTSADEPELEGTGGNNDQSSKVAAVVAFNPVSRLIGLENEVVDMFMGGSYEDVPENFRLATPSTFLDMNDPPMLILHGRADETVPYHDSEVFVNMLMALGVEVEFFGVDGQGHGWFNAHPHFEETSEVMFKFMDKHLK